MELIDVIYEQAHLGKHRIGRDVHGLECIFSVERRGLYFPNCTLASSRAWILSVHSFLIAEPAAGAKPVVLGNLPRVAGESGNGASEESPSKDRPSRVTLAVNFYQESLTTMKRAHTRMHTQCMRA